MDQKVSFDIDALVVFGKVVECGSLSKAAALLDMPKSTVTRKISRLETDLGVKLLRRNTHRIAVTDLGSRIYNHGLKILAEAHDVSAVVDGAKREPQGLLRVALPVFIGIDYAARVGSAFLTRYPKARLDIRLVDNAVHPIKDGFDVVFGAGPLRDSTLIARKVFSLEGFLCAAPAFVKTLPRALKTPTQLADAPCIDSGIYGAPRKLLLTQGRKRVEIAPPIRARSNNFQISKQYLLQGLGFGAMPTRIICADELANGSLVPLFPDWHLEAVDVYMICPFQLSASNLVQAFYEMSVEVIRENIARSDRRLSGR